MPTPEPDSDLRPGRHRLRFPDHLTITQAPANAVAAGQHRQGAQGMQGGRSTFDLFPRPADPTALRGDEALIKGDKTFAQHPYQLERA